MWYVTSADYKHVYIHAIFCWEEQAPRKISKTAELWGGHAHDMGGKCDGPLFDTMYRITEANPEGAIIHTILKLKPTQGRGGEGAVIHTILKLKPTQFFGAVD